MIVDMMDWAERRKEELRNLSPKDRVAIASLLLADVALESSVQGQDIPRERLRETTQKLSEHLVRSIGTFFGHETDKR
jgi:hypothetical protein